MRFPESEYDDTSDAAAYQSDIARPGGAEKPRDARPEPMIDTAYGKVRATFEEDFYEEGPQYPDIGI